MSAPGAVLKFVAEETWEDVDPDLRRRVLSDEESYARLLAFLEEIYLRKIGVTEGDALNINIIQFLTTDSMQKTLNSTHSLASKAQFTKMKWNKLEHYLNLFGPKISKTETDAFFLSGNQFEIVPVPNPWSLDHLPFDPAKQFLFIENPKLFKRDLLSVCMYKNMLSVNFRANYNVLVFAQFLYPGRHIKKPTPINRYGIDALTGPFQSCLFENLPRQIEKHCRLGSEDNLEGHLARIAVGLPPLMGTNAFQVAIKRCPEDSQTREEDRRD
jgi:hypothetical protein